MIEFMREALLEAKKAYDKGEVPIGAVIVLNDEIIGRGHNLQEQMGFATSHAEILAIQDASSKLGRWRLSDCDLYVTIEPCPMCAGAIINARLKKVYIGAAEEKFGAVGSKINLFECGFNHKPLVQRGFLEDECREIMSKFFEDLRKNRKNK